MRTRNVLVTSLAATIAALSIGAVGAQAAGVDLISGKDIRDGGVHRVDLSKGIKARIDSKAPKTEIAALNAQLENYESQMGTLQAQVEVLQSAAATGADMNTNWEEGLGATIQDANTVVLDSRNAGYSYASIKNLDLQIEPGAHIQYTYRLEDGATQSWGAPRMVITVDGVRYSSVGNTNPTPGYGHDNGDGTYTVDVAPVKFNDNFDTPMAGGGHVTRASLVYDGQTEGKVIFTSVVIDGQPISFQ